MTAPDLPPVQPLGPMPGTGSGSRPGGPTVAPAFPAATAQLIPLATEVTSMHPVFDDFPVRMDPALDGHDPLAAPDYSLEALGLDGDPVARVLDLRRQANVAVEALNAAVEALTETERAELVQYGWPPASGHLRAVA